MNLLIRSSSRLWPGGNRLLIRAHTVPTSASFSSSAQICSDLRRFPYLPSFADLQNLGIRNLSTGPGYHSISGMKKTLDQINNTPQLGEWNKYSIAASDYLDRGLIEPALTMLRKMEERMPLGKNNTKAAFKNLLTLYAKTGSKDELYRVWNKYKQQIELNFKNFCCMISWLSDMEDIEGAEKIFEEWESQCTKSDIRVLNKLLFAYCKKGLLEKAEAAVAKTAEQWTTTTIHPSTWMVLANGYIKHNQMSNAVETYKKAIAVLSIGQKPCPFVLNACLDYLEARGDVEGMQELIKLVKSFEP